MLNENGYTGQRWATELSQALVSSQRYPVFSFVKWLAKQM